MRPTACRFLALLGLLAGQGQASDRTIFSAFVPPGASVHVSVSSFKQRVALSACLSAANTRRPRPHLCAPPSNRKRGRLYPLFALQTSQASQVSQASQASQGEEASEEMLDVAIVGAGPAGLALAIGLLAKGLRVRVFEAAPEIKERGAAVFMQSIGVAELEKVKPGLAEEAVAAGRAVKLIHLTWPSGETIAKVDMTSLEELIGYPFLGITRHALQRVLLGHLPDGGIQLGSRLEGLDTHEAEGFSELRFEGRPLRPPATTTKSSRGGGEWRQENTGGGGSGWNQNGSSGRFAGTGSRFLQVVPLPWLAVVCFSAVELATNAYVVENENFRHLTQRCQFHVAACTVGDDSGLGSLFDLLDWVYESIDATGPTALPKLLDEDVIGIALKGTRSPNIKMSTLCHEILNALSSNEHVAAMMAKDPALRAAVVGEVRRQLFGWKSAGSGDNGGDDHEDQGDAAVQAPFAEQALETASAEDGDGLSPLSSPPMSSARQRRRQTGHVVGRGRPDGQRNGFGPRRDATTKYADAGGGGESGDGYRGAGDESGAAAAAVEPEAGEVDAAGLDAADRGVISVDPFYAALTLRTLGNIMRASRGSSSSSSTPTPSAAALASGSSGSSGSISSSASDWGRSMTLPLPLRFLYGGNLYGGAERGEAVDGEGSEWPLETRLVGDIAELMLSVSERGGEGVQLVPREPGAEVDEASQMEAQMALQGLESAAASVLRETSCQPQLVGLLMRRRPLVALVTVSWKGHSVRAEDSAAEAALNVCTAYRRLHGLPEPPKPEINFEETWTALTAWANENLADGGIGVVAADLDAREEDQDFIRQAWHAIPSLALSNPVLTVTASAAVGLASIPWGIARRWVAWRRAGETFAALSRLALPRALLWAGLRAGLGATAMTATHGPFGFRSQMRYRTLDATEGRSGTLAMSGVREVADLGYLYVILRLFPYSLLPAVVMSAMLKEGHVGTDTWGP